jgi:hypothetical protein
MPLANDVRGIGYRHVVVGEETFNSVPGLALDGILFMNSFRNYGGQYAPIGRLTFNQELGHRWGSHVYFEDRNGPSTEMLGRDCSHWSFLMDSGNSAMEGNVWIDNGNRTFTTNTSFYDFGYSGLDRYLMGFAPAEAIAPWFFITDAGAWDCDQQYQGRELQTLLGRSEGLGTGLEEQRAALELAAEESETVGALTPRVRERPETVDAWHSRAQKSTLFVPISRADLLKA